MKKIDNVIQIHHKFSISHIKRTKKQKDKAKQPQKKTVRRISSSPNAMPKQIKHRIDIK